MNKLITFFLLICFHCFGYTLIQMRRDSSANWTYVNPILSSGEPGYDTTGHLFKIGDGVTHWNDLPYMTSVVVAGTNVTVQTNWPNNFLINSTATGTGGGTVTSVNVVIPGFTSSGAVTTSGTITMTPPGDVLTNGYGANTVTFNSNVVINSGSTANNLGTGVTTAGNLSVNTFTNAAATASTVPIWDGNKSLGSIANGTGALTNNGSGVVGYYLNYATTSGNNAFTSTNFFSKAFTVSTNQNQITPDFSLPEQLISTNAAFTFLAPVGVDTTKVTAQWTLVNVTNTTAAAVAITPPANCHGVGTLYVTNWSLCYFQCYAQKITNLYCIPVF